MAKCKFNPQGSAIVLDVILCGREAAEKRLKMIFDTGATYTLIPWEVAEALGYRPEVSKGIVKPFQSDMKTSLSLQGTLPSNRASSRRVGSQVLGPSFQLSVFSFQSLD